MNVFQLDAKPRQGSSVIGPGLRSDWLRFYASVELTLCVFASCCLDFFLVIAMLSLHQSGREMWIFVCLCVICTFSFFPEFWKMLKLYKSCFYAGKIHNFVYLNASVKENQSIFEELCHTSVSFSFQQEKQISDSCHVVCCHDNMRVDGCGATVATAALLMKIL